ncbi:putative leucine-rich repeat receptor-like protein kinase [Morus notabilis]|uniref:Putative leucine-rich repeat receptor-like protein kinase n=1 Tax=Morus notabilis TaxID=981085 RepID=W9SIV1_9ROSA|nr:protein LYK2 [Morus notabilis]EXC31338.1 putative leucine-rich repeat receptor-like protein kinase [Morus notabilis]
MAAHQISNQLFLKAFVLLMSLLVLIISCKSSSPDQYYSSSAFHCNTTTTSNGSILSHCETFAILRTNSFFSSLSNLSSYLGINRFAIADANGFSAVTEFLPRDQPLLIPIGCKCDSAGLFVAQLAKTTVKGESFSGIAESLEGLTSSEAIKEKNPGVSPWNLSDKLGLVIPLPCACPSTEPFRFFLTYPVTQGDTISNLAIKFNTTREAIISANNRSLTGAFRPDQESLTPFTSLLVPVSTKPLLSSLAIPRQPSLGFPATRIPVISPRKKKSKMRRIGLYIALSGILVGVSIAVAAAFLVIQMKKKQNLCKGGDLELQQLSLSVRTTSDKKASFEGSNQDTLDAQVSTTAPRKALTETYTFEELSKATEGFSSSNHIEGSVYHGRLNGKNLAIKRIRPDIVPKIEFGLSNGAIHHHPNIIRLSGTCLNEEGSHDSFLVFEYAKNGSLKDWLHGGLAIKNQFIASCYCFLTWSQRLKICLDVAMALKYMHHIMDPCYVHRNIKSRNIFLDEEFNAKIGNFGMAKCVENDAISEPLNCTTNPSSWSRGYLAPEGVISTGTDIFAYGVVLLEVLSGQTPIIRPNEKGERGIRLSEKIKFILESENAEELREWMDSALGENYSFDAAVTLANLARACVEEDPALRPTADEIVEKLTRLGEESPQGECSLISESSSKPLVKAAANNM